MNIKLTEKELKEALKKIVIVMDTREKKNKPIIAWFDKNKVKYKSKKLDHGDYSCYLERGAIKGIDFDITFFNDIVIEKKADIDELAGNFSKKDTPRLKSEFSHLGMYGTRCYIYVTDQLFHKHLRNHNYRSQYEPSSLYKRLKGFEAQYNTVIVPISEDYIGGEIYNTLYYYVRDLLIRRFDVKILEENRESVEDGE